MRQDKELPSEYVSIRTIWLQGIDDCRKAISQRAIQEPSEIRQDFDIGDRTVVYTVDALYYSLVDFGEATLRSDIDKYREQKFTPKIKEIWALWKGNQEDDEDDELIHFKGITPHDKKKTEFRSLSECWQDHSRESMALFDYIIKTMNKYGMLFEKQPQGYSNVEMRSIE